LRPEQVQQIIATIPSPCGNLEQVVTRGCVERLETPIVKDEQMHEPLSARWMRA
jgi:hypothetical protein